MSSAIKIWSADFMESKSENESLRSRIREVEDENQDLRAQSLLQNRTIIELRNELTLLRIQMNEMAETSSLLRERIQILAQDAAQRPQENEAIAGPMTAPPLMAPPPVPPPLPSARIRISPRQVGAGEALTTPLGVSLSSPPRHRIKRDYRQGFYRSSRTPYHRLDSSEPGPSSQTPFFSSERPNYFVGLKIIPQFQSFVCSSSQPSEYNDSASDSSGSDENPQIFKKPKPRSSDGETRKPVPFSRDFELLRNVRNLHHQKVRQSILQNYNLSLPSTNGKFFFPLPWDRKNRDNPPLPSTSGNEMRYFHGSNSGTSERVPGGNRNASKVSDSVQYTFPAIHEGFHHCGVSSVVPNGTQPTRPRRLKKNIPYLPSCASEEVKTQENGEETKLGNIGVTSESLSSIEDARSKAPFLADAPLDFDQDGFQADESSNCLTSTENSLEKINIGESNAEEKKQ